MNGWLLFQKQNHIVFSRKQFPKISIITPSYNQGQYLEETIKSIIAQEYSNFELIIIDAGSSDNTVEVIRKYESWITYWVSEKDRGQSHAIQKGLEVATGDIINWINSDDIVAPGTFQRIAAEFDLEKYDAICGYCDFFLHDLDHLDLRNMRMGIGATVGDTISLNQINQPSTYFKASVIKQLGIDEQFRYTMDLDLWYRYLLVAGQRKVLLSEGLFSYFRLHDSSKSVAEGEKFHGDVWKVYYNVLYSMQQHEVLLKFASHFIPTFSNFRPTRYAIQVSPAELRAFVRYVAWEGVHYYNSQWDQAAARKCLVLAYHNGQKLNKDVVRQMVKHYVLPTSIAKWFAARSAK
ncbi:glycosyltransferase [Hymenobacter tibetensis]|uniref:Glycosyltransferase n=1 Tax=Hymenobacter tibetensis TaxID=497967 RepID=A0ABY4D421_9BACT|nr:glycosyltransferase family 2 protein [Hymenobacter tibetensis]UOG75944.1 glycosyltransferase [Hymenobacter tibetensis]